MKQKILLSAELREKVYEKIAESIRVCNEHYKINLQFPDVRFDVKNKCAGLAYQKLNRIRFNLVLLVENEEHFIKHIVPHEVAHLVTPLSHANGKSKRLGGHGKAWQEVMSVLGIPADRYHEYDLTSLDLRSRPKKSKVPDEVKVAHLVKIIKRLPKEMQELLVHFVLAEES